ncbi:MAG: presqualene diphosphate synthase HpnD [Carbonactinosporaceae bacterium]
MTTGSPEDSDAALHGDSYGESAEAAVDRAYRHCQAVTRARARNFSYGIRLLPPVKRRALCAVYAFARRIDDVGDGDLPPDDKLRHLGAARARLAAIGAGAEGAPDEVLLALADAAARLPIPLDAFHEVIDGCEADVRGTRYETFHELHGYCRCVAGSVGRLSLGVFTSSDPPHAVPLADALGVALQLTNILRDLLEDRRDERIYLPAEDLDRFGCSLELDDSGGFADPPEKLAQLVAFEAARAEDWYARGLRLLPLLDPRSAACCATMADIYHRLLRRIAADPGTVLRGRASLPGWEKGLLAARALASAVRVNTT